MWLEIGLLCVLLFGLFYRYITKDFHFFDGQGIPVSPPIFPWGSKVMKNIMMGKSSFIAMFGELAEEFPNTKISGFFMFNAPRYFVNDEEIAKQILIKDFEYFVDRSTIASGDKYFSKMMTNLEGDKWKKVRMIMSGVFTSGRLRQMFPHLNKVGQNFEAYLDKVAADGKEVDAKTTGGCLTLDGIASAVFGIESNSFDDPDNTFRVMALRLTNAPGYRRSSFASMIIKTIILKAWPKFGAEVLELSFMDKEAMNFFADIIKQAFKQRQETGQKRNDLIDLINEELQKSKAGGNSDEKKEYEDEFEEKAALDSSKIKETEMDVDQETLLVAQALLFFFAGFDTSSSGFGAICHKLCMNEDAQEKLHHEVVEQFGVDGEVTFDKMNELRYLDWFISESLRTTDLVPMLERVCTKNYKVPGTAVVIPKGTVVDLYIPDLHMDNNNYVNAKEFDPENFNPENKPNKFSFQTFGQGPRNCIGMRYALLVLKVGIVYMVRKFKLVRGSTMQDVMKVNKELNHFEGGLPVIFQKRDNMA
eukprot:TRINITY_DN6273_c0_g1_i2.p1 TRINITY_DN6273_c0_g1~~TRINITY_DN6273_c0_g1_i2.p1  ORF type:complete len:542 (+),score=114.34 TRINITY_DN6273_c0_g1_i2:29-1627(+)